MSPNVTVDTRTDDTRRAWAHYDDAVQRVIRLLQASSAAVAQRQFGEAERDRHAAYEVARTLSRKIEESFELYYGSPDEECSTCSDVLFACQCDPYERED